MLNSLIGLVILCVMMLPLFIRFARRNRKWEYVNGELQVFETAYGCYIGFAGRLGDGTKVHITMPVSEIEHLLPTEITDPRGFMPSLWRVFQNVGQIRVVRAWGPSDFWRNWVPIYPNWAVPTLEEILHATGGTEAVPTERPRKQPACDRVEETPLFPEET